MNAIRRYGLFLYWLIFAFYCALLGKIPGYGVNPAHGQFFWGAVIEVWIVLAIAVLILHAIIAPQNYSTSSPRFGIAFGFSVLLVIIFSIQFGYVDLAPVRYVPIGFAHVTAILTLVCAIAETTVIVRRKRKAKK